ncbi:hypothetical protein B296_00013486, partial [Ensete ventricosum]
GACVQKLSGKTKLEDSKATKQIIALLSAPLEKYKDISTALNLPNYPRVMDHLDNATNKVMSAIIIQNIMKNNTCISTADKVGFCSQVDTLFELIKGLVKDTDEAQDDEVRFGFEFSFQIISTVRKHILLGGPKRLAFTVPPLVFSALKVCLLYLSFYHV